MILTTQRLKELLYYDPATGIFTWISLSGRRAHVGDHNASYSNGYSRVCIDNKHYFAHRLAWFYMLGKWPHQIDHKDGDKLNNRLENLRDSTHSLNQQNRHKSKLTSQTGMLGVTRHGSRFKSQITLNRKNFHIGVYDTAEEAHASYVKKKRELHIGGTI